MPFSRGVFALRYVEMSCYAFFPSAALSRAYIRIVSSFKMKPAEFSYADILTLFHPEDQNIYSFHGYILKTLSARSATLRCQIIIHRQDAKVAKDFWV